MALALLLSTVFAMPNAAEAGWSFKGQPAFAGASVARMEGAPLVRSSSQMARTATQMLVWSGMEGSLIRNDDGRLTMASTAGQGVTAITGGENHTCALLGSGSGSVKCWGLNESGQLGNNSTLRSSVPVDVIGLGGGAVKVEAGRDHTCALTASGAVKCWGSNQFGQLGNGSTINSSTPVEVVGLGGVTSISLSTSHTCALLNTGAMKCWGRNDDGRLAIGSQVHALVPAPVTGLQSGVSAISAGGYSGGGHTCAITTATAVKCWGFNNAGQLGLGTAQQDPLVSTYVSGMSNGVATVTTGGWFSCAVAIAGSVKCWGYNFAGQLGNTPVPVSPGIDSNVPVDVLGLGSQATAISSGIGHSCALLGVGTVRCWGNNHTGQLGHTLGLQTNVGQPVSIDVAGLDGGVSSVAVGGYHSCALLNDGSVKCWGLNENGQLGDGNFVHESRGTGLPVDVLLPTVPDTTQPTITATATTEDSQTYVAGTWTNRTVTVRYTCSDPSGVNQAASDLGDDVLTSSATSTTGTCVDNAGNTASVSFGPILIETTPPTLTPTVIPGEPGGASGEFFEWAPRRSMPTPRYYPGSVVRDGLVFTIGGTTDYFTAVGANEVYDASTDSWKSRAPMPYPRNRPTTVLGPDGKIYLIGGHGNGTDSLATVDVYDPATDTWARRPDAPVRAIGMSVAKSANGDIYLFGGYPGCCSSYLRSVFRYDPIAHTFTPRASMPKGIESAVAILADNGKIYLFGGNGSADVTSRQVYSFDPSLNTWQIMRDMPLGVSGASGFKASNGRIYLFNVRSPGGTPAVMEYDPATDTWRLGVPPPGSPLIWTRQAIPLEGGRVLVLGGSDTSFPFPWPAVGFNLEGTLAAGSSVTVRWSCTDSLSGVNLAGSDLADDVLSGAGTASATCLDTAGNAVSESYSVAPTPDTTPPAVAADATSRGAAYAAGTSTTTAVTVHFTCSDNGWGVASCPADIVYSTPGTYTASGTATDNAGNSTSTSFGPIVITAPAEWTYTANGLAIPRYNVRATTLLDGKVLVEGGFAPGQYLTTSDIFDPVTGLWTPAGRMATGRGGHIAVRLQDGRVVAAGGYPHNSSTEIFDPASRTWSSAGSMSAPRDRFAAVLLADGRVLAAGGNFGCSTALVELFNPTSRTWTPIASMNVARSDLTATLLLDGRVLVAGGGQCGSPGALASAEIFDPATGRWTLTGSMHGAGGAHAAVRLRDGKVLVVGGGTSTAEIYDPATGVWTVTASMHQSRFFGTNSGAFLMPDGNVLVVGEDSLNGRSTSERYIVAEGRWTLPAAMNEPHCGGASALLADGRAIVVSGTNCMGGTSVLSSEVYGAASSDTTPPTIFASATVAGGAAYMAGTATSSTVTVHFTCGDSGSGVASCPADIVYDTPGTHTASGTATDIAGNSASAGFGPIQIVLLKILTQSPLPGGTVGQPYTTTFEATGGTEPYSWSATGLMPPGLALSQQGVLSGTPTASGTYGFTVRVTDSSSVSTTRQFTLTPPPPTGQGGQAYPSTPIQPLPPTPGGGGPAPTCSNYILAAGSDPLPPGMSLDPGTGALSGTPLNGGIYHIVVQCTYNISQSVTADFLITITNPAPILTALTPSLATEGGPALTVVLAGKNFVIDSVVRWNGVARPTTYVSATELHAAIPPSDISTPGSAVVTVFNPAPAGGESNALSFTVDPADKTAPSAAPTQVPTANSAGWNNTNVTVDWHWTDNLSGIDPANCTMTSSSSGEGSITLTASCKDLAGNTATATYTVNVDRTLPTIVAEPTTLPNGSGWYNSDVAVHFTCADGGSGIPAGSCPADQLLNTEGTAVSSTAETVNDAAGNITLASNVVTVNLDKTPPTAAPTQAPPANGAGWNNTNVTVDWNWTDNLSGIDPANCTMTSTSSGEGTIPLTASCKDLAGNTAAATYSVKVDRTLPTIVAEPTTLPNGSGWYNSDVAVHFTCADGGSGIPSGACPPDQRLSTEGAAVSSTTETVTDAAGNISLPSNVVTVSLDKTPPSAAPTQVPAANGAGWNNTDVTVDWHWTDNLSGIDPANCTMTSTSSGEGTITLTASCKDLAGNSATTTYTVNVDQTLPTIVAEPTTLPNGSGWYNSDVAVHFTCADGGSGIPAGACPPDQRLSTEGAAVSSTTETVTDAAGNISLPSNVVTVSLDKTPPTAAPTQAPPANGFGWNNSGVTVDWNWTDNLSGIDPANCTMTSTSSGEGTITLTASCKDLAGNTATTTYTVNVDQTLPTAAPTQAPPANGLGWNNTDVVVDWSWTDGGSGTDPANCQQTSTSSGEGTITLTSSCTDLASNTATASYTVRVDQTGPTAAPTQAPPANGFGWNNTDVVVHWNWTDNGSEIDSTSCTPASMSSGEGTITLIASCKDLAGNTATAAYSVKVDQTLPLITIASPLDLSVQAVGLVLTFSATDALSGIDTVMALLNDGTTSTTTLVESGHVVAEAGVYTLTVTATDRAGNSTRESRMFVVYDASAGFVTGGGWITSPVGAYRANLSLTGKATFGFVSQYKKGANVPTGNTQFQFHAAGLDFKSTAYEWLVVAGAKAQYKGTGTINGRGNYRFFLTAIDGDVNGGGGLDRFRIRIWDSDSGGLVYDNQLNAPDDADPTTALGGGSIVIHK